MLLDHLAHCRNILGFDADTVPERRFAVLVQLAQRFTELALAAEKDLLSFRQAFEAESFSLLQASNQLAAAEATVEIERLKADNALGEVGLAGLQLGQAQFTSRAATLIANGLSDWENVALTAAWTSAGLSSLAVLPAIASMVLAGAGVATAATGIGAVPGAVMATVGAAGTLLSTVTGGLRGRLGSGRGVERRCHDRQLRAPSRGVGNASSDSDSSPPRLRKRAFGRRWAATPLRWPSRAWPT